MRERMRCALCRFIGVVGSVGSGGVLKRVNRCGAEGVGLSVLSVLSVGAECWGGYIGTMRARGAHVACTCRARGVRGVVHVHATCTTCARHVHEQLLTYVHVAFTCRARGVHVACLSCTCRAHVVHVSCTFVHGVFRNNSRARPCARHVHGTCTHVYEKKRHVRDTCTTRARQVQENKLHAHDTCISDL